MNLAPIVLFVYNRPWHTLNTLNALVKNELANQSTLIIYSDGAKDNANYSDLNNVSEVRKVIREKSWCKTVRITERKHNLGLAQSIIQGVTETLNEFDKVIVLEDDIECRAGFLSFSNSALNIFKYEKKIFGISGYRYPIKSINKVKSNLFFLPISSSWGWATWKDRWETINFDIKLLVEQLSDREDIDNFNFGTHNFHQMIQAQQLNKIDSWAIQFYANMFLQNGVFLYPKFSLVKNKGFDGSGIHTNDGYDFFKSELKNHVKIEFLKPHLDPILVNEVKNRGKHRLPYRLVKSLKIALKKILN